MLPDEQPLRKVDLKRITCTNRVYHLGNPILKLVTCEIAGHCGVSGLVLLLQRDSGRIDRNCGTLSSPDRVAILLGWHLAWGIFQQQFLEVICPLAGHFPTLTLIFGCQSLTDDPPLCLLVIKRKGPVIKAQRDGGGRQIIGSRCSHLFQPGRRLVTQQACDASLKSRHRWIGVLW